MKNESHDLLIVLPLQNKSMKRSGAADLLPLVLGFSRSIFSVK